MTSNIGEEKVKKENGKRNIFIVVAIAITFIFGLAYVNNPTMDDEKYILEANVENPKYIEEILKQCSYETLNTVEFNSSSLSVDDYSLYHMAWVSNLIEHLSSNGDDVDNVDNYYDEFDFSEVEPNHLGDVLFLSIIYKNTHNSSIDKVRILNYINNYFIKDEGAFNYIGDSEIDKIISTRLVLEILHNIDAIKEFQNIEVVRSFVLNQYHKDSLFSDEDIISNLLRDGGTVVEMIALLDIDMSTIDADVNLKREKWAEKCVSFFSEKEKLESLVEISALFSLNKINSYLGSDNLNYTLADKVNSITLGKSFYDLYGTTKFYNNIEPQKLYLFLLLSQNTNLEFVFLDETKEYIHEMIESDFSRTQNITPSIVDNYYGLVLSGIINYEYDIEKSDNLIKSQFNQKIYESINIYSINELSDILYLLELAQIKSIDIESEYKKEIVNEVVNFHKRDSINNSAKTLISSMKIFEILGFDPPGEIIDISKKFVNSENIKKDYSNIFYFDLIELSILINDKDSYTSLMNNFQNVLDHLFRNDSFAQTSDTEYGDVFATHQALRIIYLVKDRMNDSNKYLSDRDINNILVFLSEMEEGKIHFSIANNISWRNLQGVHDNILAQAYAEKLKTDD